MDGLDLSSLKPVTPDAAPAAAPTGLDVSKLRPAEEGPAPIVRPDDPHQVLYGVAKGIPNAISGIADLIESGTVRSAQDILNYPSNIARSMRGEKPEFSTYEPKSGAAIQGALSAVHLNPRDYFPEPQSSGERIMEMAGEGAITSLMPGGQKTGLERLAQIAKELVTGASAGAASQAAVEAAPDNLKGVAGLAAGLGGGLAGHAIASVPEGAINLAKRGVEHVAPVFARNATDLAPEAAANTIAGRIAAKKLAGFTENPEQAITNLGTAEEFVPGSTPTSAQAAGDRGLLDFERTMARNDPKFKAALLDRVEQQNTARVAALDNIEQGGDIGDAVQFFRDRMRTLEQHADTLYDRAERAAHGQVEGFGDKPAAEVGEQARTAIASRFKSMNAEASALWNSIDPEGKMHVMTQPLVEAGAKIYGTMGPEAQATLSPAEKNIANLIGTYGDTLPFQRFKELRSLITGAMRDARSFVNPNEQAYRRLSMLRDSVEQAVEKSVADQFEADPRLADQFVKEARDWYATRSAAPTPAAEPEARPVAPAGAVRGTEPPAPEPAAVSGASGAERLGPAETPSDQGLPENAEQPAAPVEAPALQPRAEGEPLPPGGAIQQLDPREIGVDARRFQFKEGGDEQGVTERLQGVQKWDPRLAGTALVYRDAAGKDWVADGHQRMGLARRLIEAGHPPFKVNAFILDAKDGITDADARAIAAVKNIAEGTGTPIDAAKVLRAARETGVDLPPLPPRSALVRDGEALAELSPEAFGMVINEVVPAAQGAIVGRMVKDPAAQEEAVRVLAKLKPDNARQAEMVIRDLLNSGVEQMTRQGGLFGEEAFASSVVLERAKVADQALKLLKQDKKLFGTLVNEAERIEGAGNALNRTVNAERLSTDEKAADLLTQLAFRAGPVSTDLTRIARALKAGDTTPNAAARDFLGTLRRAIESGLDERDYVGGAGSRAAGEEAAPLERDTETKEMFQSAPPVDTPAFKRWFGDSKVVDENGAPLTVYHGSARSDRIAERGKFDKKRATSGPMAYFTDDPEIASSYATKKSDTSLPDEEHYAQRFLVKPEGYRGKARRIDDMWWALPADERERIAKLAPRVTFDDSGTNIILAPEGHANGNGSYDWELKQARGNPLKALAESWLSSGSLFDEEDRFLDVLREAGVTSKITYNDPHLQAGGVLPVYLSIRRPLDAAAIPDDVVAALKQAAKGKRAPKYSTGKDMWDKTVQDPREWIARLAEDIETGTSSYAWSSIPDWVTDVLRAKGYDGIKDTGGKAGGQSHAVWIPFDETQVKSTFNRGTFDPNDPRILYQRGEQPTGKLGEFDTEPGIEGKPQALIPGVKPVTEADRMQADIRRPLAGGNAPPPKGGLFDEEAASQRDFAARQGTLFQSGRKIADTMAERFADAGRSPEEARAAGDVIDAFYTTMADRLGVPVDKLIEQHPLPQVRRDVGGDFQQETPLFQPAYHGTPHIFDKFSTSKIGTGEGAQAYGHGLYFSSEKAVAQHYRNKLAGTPDWRIGGREASKFHRQVIDQSAMREWLENNGTSVDDIIKAAGQPVTSVMRSIAYSDLHDLMYRISDDLLSRGNLENSLNREATAAATAHPVDRSIREANIDAVKKMEAEHVNPGRLYHVDVPEHHELMNWDKPLSEQPEAVRAALSKLGFNDKTPDAVWINGTTPTDFIDELDVPWGVNEAFRYAVEKSGGDKAATLKNFRDAVEAKAAQYDEDGEARALQAVDKIERAVKGSDFTFGQPPKLAVRDFVHGDDELASLLEDASKGSGGDPENIGLALVHDPALRERAERWATAHGEDPKWADLAIEKAAKPYFDRAAIVRNFVTDNSNAKLSGEQIYKKLSDRLSGVPGARGRTAAFGDQQASEALREAGIPGHQYIGHESGKTNYVVYDDSRVNIRDFEQPARGAIEFGDTGSVIKLFDSADASTAIHEAGHHFLKMFRSMVNSPDAPEGIVKDWRAATAWWEKNAQDIAAESGNGVNAADVRKVLHEGTTGDRMKDLAIDRGLHEQWARGFESYLRDGKAPNSALRAIFQQFKDWLTQIYRNATQLGVKMSPEIQGVFDRMLASDQSRAAVPQMMDEGAAKRFSAATAATRQLKDTFGAKPVKQILRRPGATYPYEMSSEGVANALFKPGAEGAAAIRNAMAAGAPREAIEDAAIISMKRAALKDGIIDPAKLEAWRAKHVEGLREVPALDRRLTSAKQASEALADIGERRKAAIDAVQRSAVGKMLKVGDEADVPAVLGRMLGKDSAVADMRSLAAEAKRDPDALAGLRRGLVEHMVSRLRTPKDALRADTFQRFLGKNAPALAQILSPEQMQSLRAIAQDLKRASRDARAPGGGSDTAENLASRKTYGFEHPSILGQIFRRALGSAAVGVAAHMTQGPILGALSAAGSFLGGGVLNALREAGMRRVDDLVREAVLDPDMMKALLMKAPKRPDIGSAVKFREVLGRIVLANLAINAARGQDEQRRSVGARAGG